MVEKKQWPWDRIFGTIIRAPVHQEPLHQFFHLSSHIDLNTKMLSGVRACVCLTVQVSVLSLHFPWDKSSLLFADAHARLRGPWVSRELFVSSTLLKELWDFCMGSWLQTQVLNCVTFPAYDI